MTNAVDIDSTRKAANGPLLRLPLVACTALLMTCCNVSVQYVQAPSDDLLVYESQTDTPADAGQIRFLFDDMSGLSTRTLATNAFPWKVVTTALLLARQNNSSDAVDASDLAPLLQEFGFLMPAAIANWTGLRPQPRFGKPMGIVTGTLESPLSSFRLEVANISCAACHAGVTYDVRGNPQHSVWLGQPNTSVNFQAFVEEVYRSLPIAMRDQGRFIAALQTLYPDTDSRELNTIRKVVFPAIAERYAKFDSQGGGSPLGYYAGSGGLTNGLGSLKNVLGLLPAHGAPNERGLTSIPDLGSIILRSSFLCDGVYAPKDRKRFRTLSTTEIDTQQMKELAEVVTVFTVPIMGVEPRYAINNIVRTEDIVAFLAKYKLPPFPGPIDRVRARRGQAIYREACSSCHGTYSDGLDNVRLITFPNRLSPIDSIGTDLIRSNLADQEVAAAINGSPFGQVLEAAQTGGYVAPRLTGLWATAPYLHNGSVPTLWDLLNPDQRPAKFEVGGHRLDFVKVGIAGNIGTDGVLRYAPDYKPWAKPSLYDTSELGQSNRGHEKEVGNFTEDQKWDLLEYLKLL